MTSPTLTTPTLTSPVALSHNTRISVVKTPRAAAAGVLLLALGALGLGSTSLGCGGAAEQDGALPLVTIAECEAMDGAPLFDPEDELPLELSCPDGLEAIAEFEEDFYGSRGGVCCTSPAPDAEGPSSLGSDLTSAP